MSDRLAASYGYSRLDSDMDAFRVIETDLLHCVQDELTSITTSRRPVVSVVESSQRVKIGLHVRDRKGAEERLDRRLV